MRRIRWSGWTSRARPSIPTKITRWAFSGFWVFLLPEHESGVNFEGRPFRKTKQMTPFMNTTTHDLLQPYTTTAPVHLFTPCTSAPMYTALVPLCTQAPLLPCSSAIMLPLHPCTSYCNWASILPWTSAHMHLCRQMHGCSSTRVQKVMGTGWSAKCIKCKMFITFGWIEKICSYCRTRYSQLCQKRSERGSLLSHFKSYEQFAIDKLRRSPCVWTVESRRCVDENRIFTVPVPVLAVCIHGCSQNVVVMVAVRPPKFLAILVLVVFSNISCCPMLHLLQCTNTPVPNTHYLLLPPKLNDSADLQLQTNTRFELCSWSNLYGINYLLIKLSVFPLKAPTTGTNSRLQNAILKTHQTEDSFF